jgi:hypothetical protein
MYSILLLFSQRLWKQKQEYTWRQIPLGMIQGDFLLAIFF